MRGNDAPAQSHELTPMRPHGGEVGMCPRLASPRLRLGGIARNAPSLVIGGTEIVFGDADILSGGVAQPHDPLRLAVYGSTTH